MSDKNTGPAAPIFDAMDGAGMQIERQADTIEMMAAGRPLGSAILGAGIALSVILGGLATFIIVFLILVKILN